MISVVEFFIYVGVYLHYKEGGSSAFRHREEKGRKAFGALCGQLVLVPFLPFARTVELGESIVGGAYLYGAEFWGPFLMMDTNGEGSCLDADYLKWIHWFSRKETRLERCFGWVPVRSLDDKAVAACVCAGI